jgi:hypothetical protein
MNARLTKLRAYYERHLDSNDVFDRAELPYTLAAARKRMGRQRDRIGHLRPMRSRGGKGHRSVSCKRLSA